MEAVFSHGNIPGIEADQVLGAKLAQNIGEGVIKLGAYAVTFPRARVATLVPLFPFFPIVHLSALVVLGLWFVLQFFSGALSLAWSSRGGVAWWAHIGGFVFGMIVMKLFAPRRRRVAPVESDLPW